MPDSVIAQATKAADLVAAWKLGWNLPTDPVPDHLIMGEYGAAFQTASSQPYRRYWIEYVTKAAHDRGVAPVLWDAGQDLVNRENLSLRYTDLHEALVRATTSSYNINQIALPK